MALITVTAVLASPAAAHKPSPRTPPQAKTGNCAGALPIVVASDAAAQSDMYSAVTLAGALGTECIILAGARDQSFPATELECLDAAASEGYVVGGALAVPGSKIVGRSLTRIAGADRWETAQAVGAEAQRVLTTLDDATWKRNAGTGKAGTRGCGSGDSSDSSSDSQDGKLSASEISAQVLPSIPTVQACGNQGIGILIEGGYIVTGSILPFDCAHVTVLFPDGTVFTDVNVLADNPWADIAVLGPIQTTKRKLTLADGESLPPGSDLYLISYRAEFEGSPRPIVTKDVLSRVRQWASYDLTLLNIDSRAAGFRTSGPLFDDRGRVVGVLTSTWNSPNVDIATSAIDLVEIIEAMLDDSDDYEYSFDWAARVGDSGAKQRSFRLPAGLRTRSYLINHDGRGDVTVQLHDCAGGTMWVDDWYWSNSEAADEGVLPRRIRFAAEGWGPRSFVEIRRSAPGSASCRLQSNVDLIDYFDESGTELELDSDGNASSAGFLDYVGDEDAYEIELSRNDVIRFWVDSNYADTHLTIYDHEGVLVAEDDDNGPQSYLGLRHNPEIRFRVPDSGTYFVNVSYHGACCEPAGPYLLFAETGVTVTMGRADWSSGYFQAELYRQMLEELGYDVTDPADLELAPNSAYIAMAEGQMDFWANSWYPAHRAWLAGELPDGSLVGDHLSIVGEEMIAGGLQGFLVTKSFADEYGVYTMDQLNSNADALASFDATDPVPGNGIADIFGCPEQWSCHNIITNQILFSDWDNINQVAAGYDAMLAQAVDSANEGVPMVAYTWGPSRHIARLRPGDNVYWMGVDDILDDSNPSGTEGGESHSQRGADGSGGYAAVGPDQCPSAADNADGLCPIGWITHDILVTANNDFLAANPVAAKLLEVVKLSVIEVSQAGLEYGAGVALSDLATEWIANNRAIVDTWLDAARAAA